MGDNAAYAHRGLRYWAKVDRRTRRAHLLPYHLLDVGACATALLDANPDLRAWFADSLGLAPPVAGRALAWLAALHDIGKAHPSFQGQAPDVAARLGSLHGGNYDHRHDTLAWWAFQAGFGDHLASVLGRTESDRVWWRDVLVGLWPAVSGHHGQPPKSTTSAHGPAKWWPAPRLEEVNEIEGAVRRAMGLGVDFPSPAPPGEAPDVAVASWVLAGFVTLADWLGSNADVFELEENDIDLDSYWRQARARGVTAVRQAGLAPVRLSADSGTSTLFPGLEPRPMQKEAEKTPLGKGPCLFIIEDQTGAGKTQAALVLAHRLMRRGDAGGLFFGLPTMATADAMYSRMREDHTRLFAEEEPATLALLHGQSKLRRVDSDDAAPTLSAWMQDSRKKAFLSHVGIGTIDQALLSVLPVRHQSLRLFALANRVLIVDEVHAYDAYMMRLLCKLLAHHRRVGGSAIILSATLPKSARRQLIAAWGLEDSEPSADYPLLTLVAEKVYPTRIDPSPGLSRSIRIELHETPERLADALREATSRGLCAGWIRNTVDDALDVHALLAAEGADVYHSRFMGSDRREREAALVGWAGKNGKPEERAGKVVISTQVLEQSLDIDFDVLATDLAPMDLVLQRAGRLQRHDRAGRDHPPTLHVLCPPWADADAVREDWFERAFPRAQWVY